MALDLENPVIVISLALGALLFFFSAVGGLAFVAMRPRMRLKKRIEALGSSGVGGSTANIANKAESRRQKRIQDKVKQLKDKKDKKGQGQKIRLKLLQAGVDMEVKHYVIACIAIGVVVTAIGAVLAPNPAFGLLVGPPVGFLLPQMVLGIMAGGRQKDFTKNFADAIDVVVRGIRSGLPVGECLNVVGREFPGPVGEEFRAIIDGQNLGMSLDEILRRGLERMPTAEFKFFAIVLQIQKQTGGNLADTLAGLSQVLRDRKKMRDKVKALSSEAKASAMIIASLPFFVMGMLSLVNPEYLGLLFTDTIGHFLLGGGLFWGLTGIIVMAQMINFDI